MLTELRISDFAVIDSVKLECAAGFLVFTGETGAGKSILVDALSLLVGGRATADYIRAGAEEAVIEAAFAVAGSGPLAGSLRAAGYLADGEQDLIIRRILSRSGRHRIYINGQLAPLHVLQSLAGCLIDIHGQHEQQSLLALDAQREALDAFGRLTGLRADYIEAFHAWQARRQELEQAVRAADDRRTREDLLRFQERELDDARIQPGEDVTLAEERQRLAHVHRLSELADQAYDLLYGGEESLLSGLRRLQGFLKELGSIDSRTQAWAGQSEEAGIPLQELAAALRNYRGRVEQDPSRLAEVEERLDRLHRLIKKYGGSLEALLAHAAQVRSEVAALGDADATVDRLREAVEQARGRLEQLARELSERRMQAAAKLETKLAKELAALRMEGTKLRVAVRPTADERGYGPHGADHIEYQLSANKGEPLLSLGRIASGGELSRVMLALKTILADTDRVPVLVFDEIDSGVGGAVAAVMGKRLKALGEIHQVLCVTHLPQIASQATSHYRVDKTVVQGRTVTRVRRLDAQARREEIARMLAGLTVTQAVRKTAAEMLEDS
jgi:DNA repair protein RecN (Recombination protein N)